MVLVSNWQVLVGEKVAVRCSIWKFIALWPVKSWSCGGESITQCNSLTGPCSATRAHTDPLSSMQCVSIISQNLQLITVSLSTYWLYSVPLTLTVKDIIMIFFYWPKTSNFTSIKRSNSVTVQNFLLEGGVVLFGKSARKKLIPPLESV